jgi:hypothetical protein
VLLQAAACADGGGAGCASASAGCSDGASNSTRSNPASATAWVATLR